MSHTSANDISGPVEIAVRALGLLASEGSLGVREIARRCRAPSSSMGRVLTSLRRAGFIEMVATSQRYHLGPAAAWLGDAYLRQSDLIRRAYPVMQELFNKVGETVSLHTLRGSMRVPITQIESTNDLRWAAQMGRTYALHAGSASKVLLAYSPQSEIEAVVSKPMEAYTPHTITDPRRLLRELKAIREKGYSVGFGERSQGAVGMAAPIFGPGHQIVACLNIAGPEWRLSQKKVQNVVLPELLQAAADISSRLGFFEGPDFGLKKPRRGGGGR